MTQFFKAIGILGLVAVACARRVAQKKESSLSVTDGESSDPLAGLKSCFDVPTYPGKCLVSASPGACYTEEGDEDPAWQCWNDDMDASVMTDSACKNIVGKAGACRFEFHGQKLEGEDISPCADIKGFKSHCNPITDKWGACYKEDSELWMCIQKNSTFIDGYRKGDCKVQLVNGESNDTYDGVCTFEQAAQTLYKCPTVPTYMEEHHGRSCKGVPFACFSLHAGVTWQCVEEGTNPSCKTTEARIQKKFG